jgi:hypothetical protein
MIPQHAQGGSRDDMEASPGTNSSPIAGASTGQQSDPIY